MLQREAITQGEPQPPLALVVEDEEELGYLLRFLLEREGYRVVIAQDGMTAQEQIRSLSPPTVVTLDVMLPHIDGFHLLALMRAQPGWEAIPILMLTGTSLEEAVVRALEAGASDYIVKPFKPEELLARIRRLVSKRQ